MKFQNVKVEDLLWSIQLGVCKVNAIRTGDFPINCSNEKGVSTAYRLDGRHFRGDEFPSLFHSKPEIIESKKKVTKTVDVWVSTDNDGRIMASLDINGAEHWDKNNRPTKGTLTYETE